MLGTIAVKFFGQTLTWCGQLGPSNEDGLNGTGRAYSRFQMKSVIDSHDAHS